MKLLEREHLSSSFSIAQEILRARFMSLSAGLYDFYDRSNPRAFLGRVGILWITRYFFGVLIFPFGTNTTIWRPLNGENGPNDRFGSFSITC